MTYRRGLGWLASALVAKLDTQGFTEHYDTAHPAIGAAQGGPADQTGASTLYAATVAYLVANGWRREELGSGWWWKADNFHEEATLGGALEAQLDADGLDQRVAIPGEPEEFWG